MSNRLLLSLFCFFTSSAAFACPNIAGEYFFKDHPWNGKMIITQSSCDSIEIKHFWPSEYPDPNSEIIEFNEFYKTDGKLYEGMYISDDLATNDDRMFHKTTFTKTGFTRVDYSGSQKKCGNEYSFNNQKGCKITETRLEFNKSLDTFVWRKIGKAWAPDWWTDDIFPLKKK